VQSAARDTPLDALHEQDENEREVLQEFISNKWDGIAGEALCTTDLRRIASNFIDFWLDTDGRLLASSASRQSAAPQISPDWFQVRSKS
jgi:hypothetical protein